MTRALDELDQQEGSAAGQADQFDDDADDAADASAEIPSPSRRWDDPPVLAAFGLILLGVAALASWLAGASMPDGDGPEAGFARDMMVHHRQAVVMADNLRPRTTDPTMAALASDIATTQQGQIGQLLGWLEAWGLSPAASGPAMAWMGHPTEGRMPGMATPQQLAELKAARGQDADELFARLMVPHHAAGIDMAEAILARTDRPEVRTFAQRMIESQQFEIDALQDWLRARDLPPVKIRPLQTEPAAGAGGGHAGHGAATTRQEGMLALVGPAARGAVRLGPVALGAAALAWLLLDSTRRWRAWPQITDPPPPGQVSWRVVAAAGLGVSGVAHLALAPEQPALGTGLGAAYWAAGVAAAALAGAVLAWPNRAVLTATLLTAATLTAGYFLFLLVTPPGATQPTSVDAVGLLTQLAHVATLLAAVALWPPPAAPTPATQ